MLPGLFVECPFRQCQAARLVAHELPGAQFIGYGQDEFVEPPSAAAPAADADAEQQVARLVELHADDAATRGCDPRSLATAQVLLATAPSPASALAAGGTDSVQRIHRLMGPAQRWAAPRQLLGATAAALGLTPVLLALTPALVALALGRIPAAQQTRHARRAAGP